MQFGQKFCKRLCNFNNFIPGEIFGFVSMIVALTGIIISFIDFPVYNIFISMVSHLGLPGMTSVYVLFDICLMTSGLINLPFALSFGYFFKHMIGENKWIRVAVIWNCISSISLTLVGLFLAISIINGNVFYVLHIFCAIVMFVGVAVYSFIYGNLIMANKDKFPISLAIFSYFVAGAQLVFLFSWKSYFEWFATFFIIAWNIIMNLYLLRNQNNKKN